MKTPVHMLIPATNELSPGKTACDIRVWESRFTEHEVETADNERLDVTREKRHVTCPACLKRVVT